MFSRHIIFSLLFVLQFLMAKANSLDGHCGLHSREGYIEFSYPSIPANLSARTWYRIVGDVENLKYPKRPLVVLHGGPAATSVYLRPTFDLFSERTGRPVIYYDQFGCGNSTHYPEKVGDESFWTVELFEAELRNVLSHLNISEDYDLYGHSWGGMLAAKHAFLSRPKGLHRLVFGGSPARMSDWGEAAQQLLSKLPQDVQDAIRENDANKTYDNPEYQNAVLVYYQNYLYRGDPWPAALNDALAALSSPDSYYITMQGPSELSIAGTLRGKLLHHSRRILHLDI